MSPFLIFISLFFMLDNYINLGNPKCPVLTCGTSTITDFTSACYNPTINNSTNVLTAVTLYNCPIGEYCSNKYLTYSSGSFWNFGGIMDVCYQYDSYDRDSINSNNKGDFDHCDSYLNCNNGNCVNNICVGNPLGSSCNLTYDCSWQGFCNTTNSTCQILKNLGENCSDTSQCVNTAGCSKITNTCTPWYSLDSGTKSDVKEFCKSGYLSSAGVCEDYALIDGNPICNYTLSSTCKYITSFTKQTITKPCTCNPDGSGNDMCYATSTSDAWNRYKNAFFAVIQNECPKASYLICRNIPLDQLRELYASNLTLYGIDADTYPCLISLSSSYTNFSQILILLILLLYLF